MKVGVYLVEDPRTPRLITEIALAKPEMVLPDGTQKSFIVAVRFWNTVGNFYDYVPVNYENGKFVDDENTGTVIIPTSFGSLILRWPTARDYEDLAAFMSTESMTFPDAASDEARQDFLRSLIGGQQ